MTDDGAVPAASTSVVVEGATLILPLGDVVDLGQEKARLEKEIDRLDGELAKFAAKLGNPAFSLRPNQRSSRNSASARPIRAATATGSKPPMIGLEGV